MVDDATRDAMRASWRRVGGGARGLTEPFYQRLFEAAPGVRPLFPEDLVEQRAKLAATLDALVFGLDEPSVLMLELWRLGERHAAYGALAEHYPAVGEALVDALRDELGDEFTPADEAAWTEVYQIVSTVMIDAQSAVAV